MPEGSRRLLPLAPRRRQAVPGADLSAPEAGLASGGFVRPTLTVSSLILGASALLLSWAPHRADSQIDQTWINGSSNWDLSTPSWDAGVAWTNGNNAIFGGTAETVTLGSDMTVNNITFNSSGFVIQDLSAAGSLTLAGPSTISVTTSSHTATISDTLPAGALTKAGAGTLVLGGNNSFAGNVQIDAGALRITHASALGSAAGTTTVANGARLELAGGITVAGETLTINGNGGNNFGALQSVSGANIWAGDILIGSNASRIGAANAGSTLTVSGVIDDGANSFTLAIRNGDSGGETILSGVNTYNGSTDVIVGILKLDGGNNRLPTATTIQIGNGANVATATFDLNGFNQQIAGLVSLGTTMARTVTNTSATASSLTVNSSTVTSYAGVVAENLNLVKAGSGTQTLSGENTYSGTTTVSGGTLQINHNNGLGSTSGGTVVNSGAQLVLDNGVTVTGETITIAGNGGNNNGALQTAVGATATWAGDIILSGSSRVGGGTSGTLIVNGVISGAGGVLFSRGNDATTVLNAVSTYTGDTQMFANGGTRATLKMGVDNAINPLSRYSTINAQATKPMDLDLNGHVLTLRALDTSANNHANGAFSFILNNGAAPAVFTISDSSGTTNFTGILADGSGGLSVVKDGASTQVLVAASTYTGSTTVKAGVLQIGGPVLTYGANGALASTQYHLLGGTLALDNLGASNNSANRLPDAASLSFQGGSLLFKGSDQAATNSSETVGTLDFDRNISLVTNRFGGTNVASLTTGQLARSAGEGLGFVNGANLGMDATSTASAARVFVTTAPPLVGTTDATSTGINASVQNTKIVPFLLGSATAGSGGLGTEASTPNTFVTYDSGTGLRPLNPVDEFSTSVTSGDNVRLTASTAVSSSTSINSLLIDGSGVNLTVNSGQTLTVDSGAILFSSGSAPLISGSGTLAFGSQEGLVTINSSGNTFITAPIAGTAGVTYHGSGNLVLGTQQNPYSGDTVLRVANVIPQSSSAGPAGAPTSGPFGTGTLILDGSTIRATTASAITVGNPVILRADTTVPDAGASSKDLTFTGPVTLENGTRTITQNSSADTIFSGDIGDGGQDFGVTVAGTGTGQVIFGGTNSYTGATTVSSATLLVNGSIASTVTASGGTLGGGGSIAGNATIQSGARITAGEDGTMGSLALSGDLTAGSGSTWLVDFISGSADFIDAQFGTIALGGEINFGIDDLSWTPHQTYQIARYSSLSGTFSNALTEGAQVGNFYIHYGSGTDDFITLEAIPEPEAWLPALLILGLGLFLRGRRRRLITPG